MKVEKSWGYYEDIFRNDNLVIKNLVIFPNQKISYQKHSFREEHWIVIKGQGLLCLNNDIQDIKEQTNFKVNKGDWHQVKNNFDINLECIEVQSGVCYEEDIERKEDKI